MTHPSTADFIRIREAAELLGVSVDTVRRWEQKGLIGSTKTPGGQRLFSIEELKHFKANRPLSIGQAASLLGVSTSSLRRFEKEGLIMPQRTSGGERTYNHQALNQLAERRAEQKAKKTSRQISPKKSLSGTANPVRQLGTCW